MSNNNNNKKKPKKPKKKKGKNQGSYVTLTDAPDNGEGEGQHEEGVVYDNQVEGDEAQGSGESGGSESESERERKKKRKREERMEAILELLTKTVAREKNKGASRAISDLQVNWLRNLQLFNPAKDDLAAWCSMVRELLPPGLSAEEALRLLGSRLPRTLGDMLRVCMNQLKVEDELSWDACIEMLVSRVTGKEGFMTQVRRTQRIRQKEGEGIREFAIRATTELQQILGRAPGEEEWKRVIMAGAHESTLLEMDKVRVTLGVTDLWRLIEVAEIHEKQNGAKYNLPDGRGPGGVLMPNERPRSQVDAMVAEIECGWCSKMGHTESSCTRVDPICGECGEQHTTRRHDEVTEREKKKRGPPQVQVQVAAPQPPDRAIRKEEAESYRSGDQQGDSRGVPHYAGGRGDGRNWRGGYRGGRGAWRGGDGYRGRGSWRGRQYPPGGGRGYTHNSEPHRGWRQHEQREVKEDNRKPEQGIKQCFICGERGHFRRECPQARCWNCGQRGHEQRLCRQLGVVQSQGFRGMGTQAQALVMDSVLGPRRDHGALAYQTQGEKREIMGKLEELERKIQQRPLPASERGAERDRSEGGGEGRTTAGKPQTPEWQGLLEGITSHIRREMDKTNESFHINPLYPNRKGL